MKVLEAVVLVIITVTVFFMVSALTPDECVKADDNDFLIKKDIDVKRFNCDEGYYNRLGTLLYNQ